MTPDGVRMKVVFQTSINSLRQKEQAIIKDGWQKIGIETELKSVDAGVFFSSDPGNPDTFAHFSVDVADVHLHVRLAVPGRLHEPLVHRQRPGADLGPEVEQLAIRRYQVT